MKRPDSAHIGVRRNDPCPCGSGEKYKKCCGALKAAAESVLAEQSVPPNPLDNNESYQRGVQLLTAGRAAEAVTEFKKAVALKPSSAALHHALGVALLNVGNFLEAEFSLRRAIALDREQANAHHDLAIVLEMQKRPLEAIEAYSEAVSLSPNLGDDHRRIGELWQSRGQTRHAIAAFHRGAAAAPNSTGGRLLGAKALLLEGKNEEALKVLYRAVELDCTNSMPERALADLLSQRGQFSDAISHYERALAIDPGQYLSWLGVARVKKFTEADWPRLTQLQSQLAQPNLSDEQRIALHFVLGKACDDLGEYRHAMMHFDSANWLKFTKLNNGPTTRFDRANLVTRVDRIIHRFTPEFFAAHGDFATADDTPVLIVGMPRSGTTLVEQVISSHRKIAAGDELEFWTSLDLALETDTASLTPLSARALAGSYLELLGQISSSASRVTDKMPFNFFQLGLIHIMLPCARVIHCQRNPIDTCLSSYFTWFGRQLDFTCSKDNLAFFYRQYTRLIDHWRVVLPPDRFMEVQYERLVNNREAETRRLIAFTGLDWDETCLTPERNARSVKTASLWQARQPVYASSVERWRHYAPWIGELASLGEN